MQTASKLLLKNFSSKIVTMRRMPIAEVFPFTLFGRVPCAPVPRIHGLKSGKALKEFRAGPFLSQGIHNPPQGCQAPKLGATSPAAIFPVFVILLRPKKVGERQEGSQLAQFRHFPSRITKYQVQISACRESERRVFVHLRGSAGTLVRQQLFDRRRHSGLVKKDSGPGATSRTSTTPSTAPTAPKWSPAPPMAPSRCDHVVR